MLQRVKITEQSLYENGYLLLSFDTFFNREENIQVRQITTNTGKFFFKINNKSVYFIDELTKDIKINVARTKELNEKAFIGDGLISFISRLLICDIIDSHSLKSSISNKIVSNNYLQNVCLHFGIESKCGRDSKGYGTTYEAIIYDIYKEKGFEQAIIYFKETVFEYYKIYTENV